jgi:CheY-like chemotaxis protein
MRSVLVIDDDPEHAEIVAALLVRRGFNVRVACDGKSGVKQARVERPDVIVLDYFMPTLDGLKTAARMRDEPGLGDVPIIFVSAWTEMANSVQLSGPVRWLGKPFRAAQLAAAIEDAIAQPAASSTA